AVRGDVDRTDPEALASPLVTGAAGLRQVGRVYRRARVARRKDVVDPVARRAVGDALRAGAAGEAVEAVLESGDLVARQAVLGDQPLGGVAARAGRGRDARGVDERARLGRREDRVLAVAVGADRGAVVAARDGLSVDARRERLRDRLVALAAGR